ncbi:hypothetical protein IAR50_001217 [Cryptococcus sp. DSM 104548]
MPPSHYDLLEIQQDASPSEIRKAYLKAVICSHPDKRPEEEREAATDVFRQVQEAYETLSDPEARSDYDEKLFAARQPPRDNLTEQDPPSVYATRPLFPGRTPHPPLHMYASGSVPGSDPRRPFYPWRVYPRHPHWTPVSHD